MLGEEKIVISLLVGGHVSGQMADVDSRFGNRRHHEILTASSVKKRLSTCVQLQLVRLPG